MARLLHRLGLASVRHRITVTVVWFVVFLAAGVGALTLSGSTVNSFKIPGQESTTALELMGERFGAASAGGTAQVVVQAPGRAKVTDPASAAAVTQMAGEVAKLPGVAAATNPLDPAAPAVSADRRAAYSTVTYTVPAQEVTDAQREELAEVVDRTRASGLTVEVRGEATQEPVEVGGPAEVIGVVVALLVLAVTYGSLVAAGMNLLTAVIGVGIGAVGITTLTGFVDLQSTTPVLAVMLGLAVGIDYALFIVTRFRQELLAGRAVPDAAAMAVGTAGSAVVTAGLTVVIALSGLSVAGIPFLTEMGLAAAGSVVVAVLIEVTLVLVFRSILVPVIGVLGFLLTIGASLGATTAVFQWGWLSTVVNISSTGPLLSLAPIIIVGILFGLAMDYQVFLVSRMHEAHAHGTPAREAIVVGFRQAAPVVVAAATIMVAVFAGFVPDGDPTIKSIAFALAIGIIFDAIIVRMIAVPAALTLLGETAYVLPRWLGWLPVIDVEDAALQRAPEPDAALPEEMADAVAAGK